MVNLVAGRPVVPELIQETFTVPNVAREALKLLRDREAASEMQQALADVRTRLGSAGASARAARAVLGHV
jgi:lipid-A-disaccharide synthase